MRVVRPVLLALVLALPGWASAEKARPDPEALAGRMLAAIGGRERWAAVRNTVNVSQQNRLEEPTIVVATISMDFTQPRFRIESTAPGLRLVRVIDGGKTWRLNRAGRIEDVPPDTVRQDLRWHDAHVYRTIHRVAARDPALALSVGAGGRLEIFEGGARLLWLALDARGEPYAFGAHGDETGSITGPWNFVRDGIHHPAWVSQPDGSWRSQTRELSVNAPLPAALFARPASPEGA